MDYYLVLMRKERRCSSVKIGTEMGSILVNILKNVRNKCSPRLGGCIIKGPLITEIINSVMLMDFHCRLRQRVIPARHRSITGSHRDRDGTCPAATDRGNTECRRWPHHLHTRHPAHGRTLPGTSQLLGRCGIRVSICLTTECDGQLLVVCFSDNEAVTETDKNE